MSIAERLKAARASLKLKQDEMVAISGIPLDTYRKYEGGKSEPGAKALAGLAKAGVDLNWLITGIHYSTDENGKQYFEYPNLYSSSLTSAAVDHASAQPAQSQSMSTSPLDSETLAYVIEEVEKILTARRLTLPAPRKAALIQLIYDYCVELGKKEPGMVERFLKFAA